MSISLSARLKTFHYTIPATGLALLCALFIVLADNRSFWRSLFAVVGGLATVPTAFVVLAAIYSIVFISFGLKYVCKPVIITFLLLASVVGYFQSECGVFIDESMLNNIVQTDYRETAELMSCSLFAHVALFGLLPSVVVGVARVRYKPFVKEFTVRISLVLIAALLAGLSVWSDYKNVSFIGREHKELRLSINPAYALYSGFKYVRNRMHSKTAVRPLAADARQTRAYLDAERKANKKTVVILVVGETARAKNFSLNGYERQTNVHLAKDNVIYFDNAYACGTSTAESLPCIFSHLDKSDYTAGKAAQYENVLDVLSRTGVRVLWRDNNSGCKGVCSRVGAEDLSRLSVPGFCNDEECFDEILLYQLRDRIDRAGSDALIVLHQKGSHGPAYYKRHPPAFGLFSPECTGNDPQSCENDALLNAYDNTILYTDFFLHRTIDFLKSISGRYNTALVYVSDHGESLGESGIYLHGMPYFLAPDEQKHIPFIVWLSSGYSGSYRVSKECLTENRSRPYSHDTIFHSLLGLFGVETTLYKQDHDVFRRCRGIQV